MILNYDQHVLQLGDQLTTHSTAGSYPSFAIGQTRVRLVDLSLFYSKSKDLLIKNAFRDSLTITKVTQLSQSAI